MQATRAEPLPSPFLPIYAALGLALGIVVGERLLANGALACTGTRLSPSPLWLLAPLPFLLALAWWGRGRRRFLIPTLLLTMLFVGGWRYLSHPFEPCFGPDDLAYYNSAEAYGRPDVMEGVVVGYPEHRESYAQYRVQVDTLWQDNTKREVAGIALVRTDLEPAYFYGDRLRIRGVPATPPNFPDFDYGRYLARKNIYTLVRQAEISFIEGDQGSPFWAALYTFRAHASAILDELLSQPYAALANGMILGIESGIPRDLYEDFNLTGTSHVIVISGSNIAIISGIFLGLSLRLFGKRKRLAIGVTLAGIAFYTLLVGADAAVTRAALMGGLFVLAIGLERQSVALVSLFVAAVVMFLLNPLTLWDVGFQLSFMATLGLILFNAPLKRWWDPRLGKRLPGPANAVLADGLLVTFAAQLTTMPLVVFYFGRLSLISFLANLLIIPVQPPIMIAGGLAALVGFVLMPVAKLIALVPYASLWWTVFVVEKLAAVPYGSIEVSAFGRLLAVLYTLLFVLGFLWWILRQEQGERSFVPAAWRPYLGWSLGMAALVVLPLWIGTSYWEGQPDGRLHIYQMGRAQSAAWLIVTPGGNRVLVDPARESPAYPLDAVLKSLPGGNRPLDLRIITRAFAEPDPLSSDLSSPSAANRLLPSDLQSDAILNLDVGLSLEVLHAPTAPTDSLLFLLRYGDFSTLLPFENNQETQLALPDSLPPNLTLLPAPYPGTGHWPQPDLLARLRPQTILLPEGSTYPPAVQEILAETAAIASVPNDVAIEIISDGRTFSLIARPYAQDVMQR